MTEGGSQSDRMSELSDVQHIRTRPAMYIGGTGFFGFVQYLVSAFDLLLENGATWIEFEIADHFRLTSDARISINTNSKGELEPFEAIGKIKTQHAPDATILMALSSKFRCSAFDGTTKTEFVASHGEREIYQQQRIGESEPQTFLEFRPDVGIFSVTAVSPSVAHSYCKRTSCLHPGVVFRVKTGVEVVEYRSTRGILDFFDAISSPYQVLHKPIHIEESRGDLKVETVFVFHSWTENRIWSFANKGRVADGGTHEAGMLDAIARLHNRQAESSVGTLAVLAIDYPGVTYEGCIKSRIGDPELRDRVCELVSNGLDRWISENEVEFEHLKKIERFQFADTW